LSIPTWGDRRRLRVGLLGGSFNPAHAGHRHVAETALCRLRLDQVWLLVSPGNPLKPVAGMAPLAARLASAAAQGDGRRIISTDIEARLGLRETWRTLRALRRLFPCVRFVWLMGADNLAQLPRWRRWRSIVGEMPFAVLPRPGYTRPALAGQAAHALRSGMHGPEAATALAALPPPAWTLLRVPQTALSATALRERGWTATSPLPGLPARPS
jgi:nicotinate-nucleotide adenylyltransferase